MEKEGGNSEEVKDTSLYYVVGAIAVVAVIAAVFLLKPKSTTTPPSQTVSTVPAGPTPTPGPITKLGCDRQYYNTVIGLPRYYMTAEGGALTAAKKVDCTFNISVGDKVVATDTVSGELEAAASRGGQTFRCNSRSMTLQSNVATKVDVLLKDDLNAEATCSNSFLLPPP